MAREIECRDLDGTGMTLLDYDGYILPKRIPDPRIKLQEVQQFAYKDGDVFLCSYPKTGSHWLSALVNLVLKTDDVTTIKQTPVERIPLIDMFDTETMASRPAPRATSTHLQYRHLPIEHKRNKGKMILIIRNPKDVATSFYHFIRKEYTIMYNGTWKFFLQLFKLGKVPYDSYFDFLISWSKTVKDNPHHKIHVVYYEDLKQNCLNELHKICDYLNKPLNDECLRAIIDRCSLDNLRDEVERKTFTQGIHDKDGKSTVYRKGEIGDWKNLFTVAESEEFDLFMEEKLKECSFRFRYRTEQNIIERNRIE